MILFGILAGFGIGLLFFGIILASGEDNALYLIVSLIGVTLLMIGVGLLIAVDIDCQNYCQCKGKYHYYDLTKDVCECLDTNKVATDCFNKCEGSAQYNSKTGWCYCT